MSTFPGGGLWATVYDTGARVKKSSAGETRSYDPLGRVLLTSSTQSDVSSSRTEFDVTGLAPWSEVTVTYDSQRRQASYYARSDSGAEDWSYQNVENVEPWAAASSHREAGSNRVNWTALLDNGTVISGFDLV